MGAAAMCKTLFDINLYGNRLRLLIRWGRLEIILIKSTNLCLVCCW